MQTVIKQENYWQLRKRQQRTNLNCIRDLHSGKMEYHPSAIANTFMKYYKDLYNLSSDSTTPQILIHFLNSVTLPMINTEVLTALNTPISDKEILDTIQSLPAHKSPGTDGFSSDYYK